MNSPIRESTLQGESLLTVGPQNGALPARDSSLPPLLEPPQEIRWRRWL